LVTDPFKGYLILVFPLPFSLCVLAGAKTLSDTFGQHKRHAANNGLLRGANGGKTGNGNGVKSFDWAKDEIGGEIAVGQEGPPKKCCQSYKGFGCGAH